MKELSALTTADRLLQPKLSRPQQGPARQDTHSALWSYAAGTVQDGNTSGSSMTLKSTSGSDALIRCFRVLSLQWRLPAWQSWLCCPLQEVPEAPLLFCAMWAALGQIHRHMNPVKAPTSHLPQIV